MVDLPLILKCPRGEEWPSTSFKVLVESDKDIQTHQTIACVCPAGHSCSLLHAVEGKMFSPMQALRIIAQAQNELPKVRQKARIAKRRRRK